MQKDNFQKDGVRRVFFTSCSSRSYIATTTKNRKKMPTEIRHVVPPFLTRFNFPIRSAMYPGNIRGWGSTDVTCDCKAIVLFDVYR